MSSRIGILKRSCLLVCGALLINVNPLFSTLRQSGCIAAEQIKVEQAGDRFVNCVLNESEATRKAIAEMTRAAEMAAERIVKRDGELVSAGDQSFSLEPVWRAGGIAFSRQYLPDKEAAVAAVKS